MEDQEIPAPDPGLGIDEIQYVIEKGEAEQRMRWQGYFERRPI